MPNNYYHRKINSQLIINKLNLNILFLIFILVHRLPSYQLQICHSRAFSEAKWKSGHFDYFVSLEAWCVHRNKQMYVLRFFYPLYFRGKSQFGAFSDHFSHLLRIRSIAPIFRATKGPVPLWFNFLSLNLNPTNLGMSCAYFSLPSILQGILFGECVLCTHAYFGCNVYSKDASAQQSKFS